MHLLTANSTPIVVVPSLPSPSSNPPEQHPHLHWASFWANLLLRYQQPLAHAHAHHNHQHQHATSFSSSSSLLSSTASAASSNSDATIGSFDLPSDFLESPAPLNLAIASTELLLDWLALLPNVYFLFLLCTRHDLHNNLRVLLGSFSVCLILIAITRIPTQICYISTGVLYIDAFGWLVFGHEIAVMFFRTVIVPLTIERVLATVCSRDYEQQKSPLIGIAAVILTLVLSTGIGVYIGSELNQSELRDGVISFQGEFYGLYHVVDVSVRLLIWIACFCVFVALLHYNQRCYAFTRLPNKHTLVQRYQFAENVRSSRLLLIVGIIVFVCNLHFDFIMVRIAYNKDHFEVEYSQSFDFVLAIALNAIPLAAIWYHPSMHSAARSHCKQMLHLFLAKCCCIRSASSSSVDGATNAHEPDSPSFLFPSIDPQQRQIQKSPRALITGQKLIFRRAEEQQVYFDELRKSWNVHRTSGSSRWTAGMRKKRQRGVSGCSGCGDEDGRSNWQQTTMKGGRGHSHSLI